MNKVPEAQTTQQTRVALWQLSGKRRTLVQLMGTRRTLEDWRKREEERGSELTDALDHVQAAIDIITEVLKKTDDDLSTKTSLLRGF